MSTDAVHTGGHGHKRPLRLLLAGGGTGGHLFPGVAVAEELIARDAAAEVLFVGTRRGIEARILPELGWPVSFIEVSGLKTVGLKGALRGFSRLPRALWQSRAIVREFAPDVVIGVGGYASGPVVLAASLMGLSTAILEQNSIPGLTNKILGRVVKRVFLSFEDSRRFFPAGKVAMSGNPIRRQLVAALGGHAAASDASDAERGPQLFILGGSQGARALNQLVPDACRLLLARGIRCSIVHQTGEADLDATRARYREHDIAADCRPFIHDMAAEYRQADLIVARAGATTVAELGVVGLPAVLIPYPFAADNHQERNAAELVRTGAARLHRQADVTAEILADDLANLLTDTATRAEMARSMRAFGRPDAAMRVVDWCAAQR